LATPAFAGDCQGTQPEDIGWALRATDAKPTTDVTGEFQARYELAISAGKKRRANRSRRPANATEHRYLLVKGLLGDHFPGYFRAGRRHLRHSGLRTKMMKVDTDVSILVNAGAIQQQVERIYRRKQQTVVILAHSKGGVDTLAALAMYPNLADQVHAVVAMQSPYGGSPIAADLQACPGTKMAVGAAMRVLFFGNPAAIADLTFDARRAFITAHPLPEVPVVSLATSLPPKLGQVLMGSSKYMLDRYELPSDGLVVPDDAVVPGSRVVRLDNMSHAEPVLGAKFGRYRSWATTEALVFLALTSEEAAPTDRVQLEE
jgi:triacylglycerol lipase